MKSGGTEGEYRRAQRRPEARVHLTDEHQRPPFVIVHENRIEVSADRSVPVRSQDRALGERAFSATLPTAGPVCTRYRAASRRCLETMLPSGVYLVSEVLWEKVTQPQPFAVIAVTEWNKSRSFSKQDPQRRNSLSRVRTKTAQLPRHSWHRYSGHSSE